MGFVHGLNPDHISAISAFVFKQPNRKKAFFTAACFAAGHIATLFFVSLFLQGFYESLPAAYEHVAAILSKMLLVSLAFMLLLDLLPSTMHSHPHEHGDSSHRHFHFHFLPFDSHAYQHVHFPKRAITSKSLGSWVLGLGFPLFGGMLALSHIRLFLSVVILFHTTAAERFAAPLCFGSGLFFSMILSGAFFILLQSSVKRYTLFYRTAQALSAAACFITAFMMA